MVDVRLSHTRARSFALIFLIVVLLLGLPLAVWLDLQNLTNLSNSVSTNHGATWQTSCASVPNTPVDRMWYAIHGNLGDPDFAIYEEYDDVVGGTDIEDAAGNYPSNQLVEVVNL